MLDARPHTEARGRMHGHDRVSVWRGRVRGEECNGTLGRAEKTLKVATLFKLPTSVALVHGARHVERERSSRNFPMSFRTHERWRAM